MICLKETRLAEWEIAQIRERYAVFSKESLYRAIQNGEVAGHPAWEDYVVWKNKEAHIARLRQMAECESEYARPRSAQHPVDAGLLEQR